MIDDALGFRPVVRRNTGENSSQGSSPKPTFQRQTSQRTPVRTSKPTYPTISSEPKEEETSANQIESTTNSRKPQFDTSKVKKKMSVEEASSPAIHDRHLQRISKPKRDINASMKSSARLYTHESAKVLESSVRLPQKKPEDNMYKIKMVLFILVSLFLMYEAMTPSRKVPYRKKK